jgi:hypothetical protein
VDTVLGLFGLLFYIVSVIALSAGVTYLVIRISPARAKKKEPPESTA